MLIIMRSSSRSRKNTKAIKGRHDTRKQSARKHTYGPRKYGGVVESEEVKVEEDDEDIDL
jgi:hypothetical protein